MAITDSEDVAPAASGGASGEWRSSPRPQRDSPGSVRFDGEDFLFHLYRGSELLQDNCVAEAKEELERALRLQPRDSESQGLLGVVYFRLGLYPRAIEIYREIVRERPDEVTPKLNLSLCYLKTGQPADARSLLEDVLRSVPEHPRAWGYLGLAFERLGDHAKARDAFTKARKPQLARRMQTHLEGNDRPAPELGAPRDEPHPWTPHAIEELDGGRDERLFERSLPDGARASEARASTPAPREPSPRPAMSAPLSIEALVDERILGTGTLGAPSLRAERTSAGLVFIDVSDKLAVRVDRVRALRPVRESFRPLPLKRRARGRDVDEAFGGQGANFMVLEGRGLVVLEPSDECELVLIELKDEFVYLREARIIGFDATIRHENGRLPASDPGPVPMVQLTGHGVVVFEVRRPLGAIAVQAERPLTLRGGSVLGWTGRLLGQAVTKEQAPFLGSGFVLFSGDGVVLLDDP